MNEQTQSEDKPEGTVPESPEQQSSEPESISIFGLTWKFVLGFLGWYLVVGLIYGLVMIDDPQGYGALIISLLVFPAQIIALFILFLVKRFRKIGWGVLSAIAVNLLISLIIGLNFNALCFIPFFDPLY